MNTLLLQLNECGSGSTSYSLDDARAGALTFGSWVDLKYKGTVLGGFWIENRERIPAGEGDRASRIINVSGRGALAILEDAIVWDWGTPDLEKERYFNSVVGGADFTTPMHHKGHILYQLLHEAITSQTNPSLDVMDRQCFHDPADVHILSWTFTDLIDSDGNVWDAAENEDLRARVGSPFLELARQYSALGQPTAGKVFEIEATHLSTGVTEFHIHQTPIGVSAANAIVHFRVGKNCTQVSDVESAGEIRNAALVAYTDPVYPYVESRDTASETAYRRRESVLESSNAETALQAYKFGAAEIANTKDPSRVITITMSDDAGPKYDTDYHLGDWIYYDDGTGTEILVRIHSLQLNWDDDVPLTVIAGCMP
jgi:hypothetical protein